MWGRVTIVITHIRGLLTPLKTFHEPPSRFECWQVLVRIKGDTGFAFRFQDVRDFRFIALGFWEVRNSGFRIERVQYIGSVKGFGVRKSGLGFYKLSVSRNPQTLSPKP